jgi:drug/metabolite transporter (DMT)-like permease
LCSLAWIASLLPIALVLVSAFLHAGWNTLLKRERDPRLASVPVALIAAVLGIVIVAIHPVPMTPRAWVWSLAAGVFEGLYFYSLGRALSVSPLGVVYTVSRGLALVIVWPVSVMLLGERVRALGVVGTVLILIGLFFTTFETAPSRERPAVGMALICGAAIAAYHLSYKHALAAGGTPTTAVAVSMTFAVALNLLVLGRARRSAAFAMLRSAPVIAAGVLSWLSFLLFLYALSKAGAGAMLTLRNTSVVFTLLLARLIGEHPPRTRWIGAGLVAIGAALLA